jgi:hypothetical protein
VGFDEAGCSALALFPDRFGKPPKSLVRDNIFQKCANVVSESEKGLWEAATASGNLFLDCGNAPPAR